MFSLTTAMSAERSLGLTQKTLVTRKNIGMRLVSFATSVEQVSWTNNLDQRLIVSTVDPAMMHSLPPGVMDVETCSKLV